MNGKNIRKITIIKKSLVVTEPRNIWLKTKPL